MENIEKNKKKYIRFFAEKYYKKIREKLTEEELYNCSLVAELYAYASSVIPEGYGKYTVFDFDGYSIDETNNSKDSALSPLISIPAKDKICEYCWGSNWEFINNQQIKDKNIVPFLRKKSVMMDRFKNGDNIVIFGVSEKPIGRTMLASIVMKEAIRLRVTYRDRGQTYDWIDFSNLFHIIEKDMLELSSYKSCDWLVVDNIVIKTRSAKQTTLMIDMIDPFFIERYKHKQPTILVFKFDIRNKSLNMEKTFGLGISRIINSKRTFKIPLCEI